MSPEIVDSAIEGVFGYTAFALIFFGVCSAIVLAVILGTLTFRWTVLKAIGVIRRRAFYDRRQHGSFSN
jgi:hypothetical protein